MVCRIDKVVLIDNMMLGYAKLIEIYEMETKEKKKHTS